MFRHNRKVLAVFYTLLLLCLLQFFGCFEKINRLFDSTINYLDSEAQEANRNN